MNPNANNDGQANYGYANNERWLGRTGIRIKEWTVVQNGHPIDEQANEQNRMNVKALTATISTFDACSHAKKVADYLDSTIVLINQAIVTLEQVGEDISLMAAAEVHAIDHAKEAVARATTTYELASVTKHLAMEETYLAEMELVPIIKSPFEVIFGEN